MEPLKNKIIKITPKDLGLEDSMILELGKECHLHKPQSCTVVRAEDISSALSWLKEKLEVIKKQRKKKKDGKISSGGSSLSYQKTIFFIDKAFEDVVNERQKRNDKTKSRL